MATVLKWALNKHFLTDKNVVLALGITIVSNGHYILYMSFTYETDESEIKNCCTY